MPDPNFCHSRQQSKIAREQLFMSAMIFSTLSRRLMVKLILQITSWKLAAKEEKNVPVPKGNGEEDGGGNELHWQVGNDFVFIA